MIGISAANALAVYPQLARGAFRIDGSSPELVEHFGEQLGRLLGRLAASPRSNPAARH